MTRRSARTGWPLGAVFAAFCTGMIVSWALYHFGPPEPAVRVDREDHDQIERVSAPRAATTMGAAPVKHAQALGAVSTSGTSSGKLRMPLEGVPPEAMKGGFTELRGSRPHEAADLLAPRNTPVHAVESGTIAKLFVSKAGGLTIYQFDPSAQRCYYYAHLERYADGLREGQSVSLGDVIGYVGTSGNAPPNTPHLHFAVFELNGDKRWWKGRAVDPYPIFRDNAKG
jgi:murein DD-endopeptidase MepM/ murein hydrolase activator NlpD